jgi:hypothetical protein
VPCQGESGEGDVLTPQEQSELAEKCRGYCDDPDPYSILNLGLKPYTIFYILYHRVV